MFLNDYAQVMKPVAQALNILPGKTNHSNAFKGYLAPTICILRDKLSKTLDIPTMKLLVQALLNCVNNGFTSPLNDEKNITASVLHSKLIVI